MLHVLLLRRPEFVKFAFHLIVFVLELLLCLLTELFLFFHSFDLFHQPFAQCLTVFKSTF